MVINLKKTILCFILFFSILSILAINTVNADPDYVIITTDTYDNAFQNLTDWKETRGLYNDRGNLTTHIELLTNITGNSSFWDGGYWGFSANNSTSCQIRNYINYTYTNHSTLYILLGGNSSVIPTHRISKELWSWPDYDPGFDLWYANVTYTDTDDYEVLIGRIPCNSTSQVDNWVNRLKIYENCTNETWANSLITTTNNGFSTYAPTYTDQNTLTIHKYFQRDKQKNFTFLTSLTSQFFVYLGHGYTALDYEYRRCSLFPNEDFKEMGYENLTYPYIHISGTCKGAQMVTSPPNNLKFHELLFGGTNLDTNRTAIAVLGPDGIVSTNVPKSNTPRFLNKLLEKTSTNFGTSIGLAYQSMVYAVGSSPDRYYCYNLFGDPETKPYLPEWNITSDIQPVQYTNYDGPKLFGPNEYASTYEYPLTLWMFNETKILTGTANGDKFSNYTLQLRWWDNSSFYVRSGFLRYDINPNATKENFEPPNIKYCFDIPDPDSPVTDGLLGTLNTTQIEYLPKGIYSIRLIVNSTDGNTLTKDMFFVGLGYLEGIITVNDEEVPVGTNVSITFLQSDPDSPFLDNGNTTITVQTKLHDGHTGYYNFSFWTHNLRPSIKDTEGSLFTTIKIESVNTENTSIYYLGKAPATMEINIDGENSPPVFSDYWPVNDSTGISFDPVLYGTISDPEGDTLHGYLRTNASGTWQNMGSFGLVGNCTINCNTGPSDVFQTLSTKYWWSMNLSDGIVWTNTTHTFTTRGNTLPTISNLAPGNKTINWKLTNTTLSFTLTDPNGDYMPFNTTTNISSTFNQSGLWIENGTYYLELASLEPNTNYTWWINVTDYHKPASTGFIFGYTNETYWFVTGDVIIPVTAIDGMNIAATALFIAMVAMGSMGIIVALIGKWKMT